MTDKMAKPKSSNLFLLDDMDIETVKEKITVQEMLSSCRAEVNGECFTSLNTPLNQNAKKARNEQATHLLETTLSELQNTIITAVVQKINERADLIDKAVEYNTTQINDLKKSLEFCHQEVVDLIIKKQNLALQERCKFLDHKVSELELKINEADRYSRRLNLRLYGLPEEINDNNLKKAVQGVCQKVLPETEMGMVTSAMDVVHRIGKLRPHDGKNKPMPRPIMIRFQSRTARDALWRSSKNSSYLKHNKLSFKEDLSAADKEVRGKPWPVVEEAWKKVVAADVQTVLPVNEDPPEEPSPAGTQKKAEPFLIKEEWEEVCIGLEDEEQLGVKSETDGAVSGIPVKSEDEEENLVLQLHQHQMESRDPPNRSSDDQMNRETEFSWNQVLNAHRDAFSSSETEISDYRREEGMKRHDYVLNRSPECDTADDLKESRTAESGRSTAVKSYSCSECRKVFLTTRSFQRHLTAHSECLLYGKGSLVKNIVDSQTNGQKKLRLFSCEECGKRFTRRTHLSAHIRVHTGERPFLCNLCGHSFGQLATLNKHKTVHTGEKLFGCDLCGQAFSRKENLNIHKRIHTGEKPFECDICGHRARRKENLNRHMKIHTEERPYECDLCKRRFSQKERLTGHQRSHAEGK